MKKLFAALIASAFAVGAFAADAASAPAADAAPAASAAKTPKHPKKKHHHAGKKATATADKASS